MTDNNDNDFLNDDDFLDDSFDDDFGMDDFDLDDDDEDTSTDGEDTGFEGFSDEPIGDDAFDEETPYEADEAFAAEPAQAVKEKKSLIPELSFNTIVIAGAVLVGAGVLLFQVMKPVPQQGNQGTFVSGVRMQGASDGLIFGEDQVSNAEIENTSQEENEDKPETQDFFNDPEALDSLEIEIQDPPPMPTPIVNEDTQNFTNEFGQEFDVVEEIKTTIPDITEPSPRPPVVNNEVIDTLSISDIPAIDNIDVQQLDAAVADIETIEDVDIQEFIEPEIQAQPIEQKAEAVKDSTEDVTSQDVANNAQESASNTPDQNRVKQDQLKNEAEIAELNNTVASLRSEIDRLKKQARKKPVTKASSTSSKKAKPQQAVRWDLRAAQPGKAWISQKGSTQLQPVVVGDVLSGIGRVQDIFYDQNRWVIKGSSQNIYQNSN